jgi:hypothetical protein
VVRRAELYRVSLEAWRWTCLCQWYVLRQRFIGVWGERREYVLVTALAARNMRYCAKVILRVAVTGDEMSRVAISAILSH